MLSEIAEYVSGNHQDGKYRDNCDVIVWIKCFGRLGGCKRGIHNISMTAGPWQWSRFPLRNNAGRLSADGWRARCVPDSTVRDGLWRALTDKANSL